MIFENYISYVNLEIIASIDLQMIYEIYLRMLDLYICTTFVFDLTTKKFYAIILSSEYGINAQCLFLFPFRVLMCFRIKDCLCPNCLCSHLGIRCVLGLGNVLRARGRG